MTINELKQIMFNKIETTALSSQSKAVKMRYVIAMCKRLAKLNPIINNVIFEGNNVIQISGLEIRLATKIGRIFSPIIKRNINNLYIV